MLSLGLPQKELQTEYTRTGKLFSCIVRAFPLRRIIWSGAVLIDRNRLCLQPRIGHGFGSYSYNRLWLLTLDSSKLQRFQSCTLRSSLSSVDQSYLTLFLTRFSVLATMYLVFIVVQPKFSSSSPPIQFGQRQFDGLFFLFCQWSMPAAGHLRQYRGSLSPRSV